MQLEQLDLPGGGLLTVYLRDCVETMPLPWSGRWCWWCRAAATAM